MFFRQLLYDTTACASYLFGCKTHSKLAVVDPHNDLVDDYIAVAEAQGAPIVAAFDTHVHADHVSGVAKLARRTGAVAYLPAGSGAEFEHVPLADGEKVILGNTEIEAIATPGHAPAHHTYLVTDRVRGDEPWFVLTGDSLLIGDAGRPDLHAHGDESADALGRALYRSLNERLLALPDHLLVYPGHYSGSVCGRGLSAHPASTIGFERRFNHALQAENEDAFVAAILENLPPPPAQQAAIIAANLSGGALAEA